MTPYQSWLIRKRRWCEHEGCLMELTPAMEVVNRNGKDFVFCSKHAGRLAAVRKSDQQQDKKEIRQCTSTN